MILVIPSGFEPLASKLGISRSILLSYGTTIIRVIFLTRSDNSFVFLVSRIGLNQLEEW
jgi:hypothetical protein